MRKLVYLMCLTLLMCIICIVLAACGDSGQVVSSADINTEIPQYLRQQYSYANRNNIPLTTFKKQQKVVEWLTGQDLTQGAMRAQEEKSLFTSSSSQYKLSTNKGDFYYRGEVKDNYPDGMGMLTKKSASLYIGDDRVEDIVYIGEFKKGRFQGYGMLFSDPRSEDTNSLYKFFQDGPNDAEFLDYYYSFVNYVEYEGNFKEGEKDGDGISFSCSIFDSWFLLNNPPDSFDPEALDFIITVGEYEDNIENGSVKEYLAGSLSYDGTMKNGERSGKGIQYYLHSNIPQYDGEWKDDKYNGKGTLYNENGEEIYNGEWKNGDLGDSGSGDYQAVQQQKQLEEEQFWQGVEAAFEAKDQETIQKRQAEVDKFISTMYNNEDFLAELELQAYIHNDRLEEYLQEQAFMVIGNYCRRGRRDRKVTPSFCVHK